MSENWPSAASLRPAPPPGVPRAAWGDAADSGVASGSPISPDAPGDGARSVDSAGEKGVDALISCRNPPGSPVPPWPGLRREAGG